MCVCVHARAPCTGGKEVVLLLWTLIECAQDKRKEMSKVVLRKFFKSYTPIVRNQHEQYFRGGYIHNTVILPADTFQVKNNTKTQTPEQGQNQPYLVTHPHVVGDRSGGKSQSYTLNFRPRKSKPKNATK